MSNCAVLIRLPRVALLVVALGLAMSCGGENRMPIFRPTPAPEVAVLVGAGDIAECGGSMGPETTARLLDRIEGIVFTAGDNAYPSGTAADFRRCYEPSWGRHKQRTRPSPGNHDYEVPGAADYFTYFGSNAGPAGLGYYSYRAGNWTVFSLNSNVPISSASPQLQWLRTELAADSSTCSAAYFHHSPFSSGGHGDHPHMREVWRELQAAGVDVVIAAHDHTYERFAPMNADGQLDMIRGSRLFIVGTGGAQLVPPTRVAPNSELRTTRHGVLKLTLRSNMYQWEFLDTGGGVGDSGVDVCR
jgi:acid phosphatase type 7